MATAVKIIEPPNHNQPPRKVEPENRGDPGLNVLAFCVGLLIGCASNSGKQ